MKSPEAVARGWVAPYNAADLCKGYVGTADVIVLHIERGQITGVSLA